MVVRVTCWMALALLVSACATVAVQVEDGFTPLFNGTD